jgi:YidC/Oxa1 family membrane protein insertase
MDGYRPLEYLINENQSFNKKNILNTSVLIAPSWGKNTIIDLCIDNLLNVILKSGMQVTLRPHPMTIRNNFEKLNELKKTYCSNQNFNIQLNVDNRDILFDSDILITDWSGIGMEYGLGLQKPVIYIDTPKKNNNPESNSINLIPIEVQVRSEIGSIVPINEIDNINIHISNSINSYNPDSILELRKKYVFMKEKPVYKSARRLLSIANANRSRNLSN